MQIADTKTPSSSSSDGSQKEEMQDGKDGKFGIGALEAEYEKQQAQGHVNVTDETVRSSVSRSTKSTAVQEA